MLVGECTCRECWHIGTCRGCIGGPVGLEMVGVVEGIHGGCVIGRVVTVGGGLRYVCAKHKKNNWDRVTDDGILVQELGPWVGV